MDYAVWSQALTILGVSDDAVTPEDQEVVDQIGVSDDPWLVAAEIADLFALRSLATGSITRFQADGATFEKSRADWSALAAALRAKAGVAGADGHAFVVAPACPAHRPELTGGVPWPVF